MNNKVSSFMAKVVSGSGRGQKYDVPTINADLSDIPIEVNEGVYAGFLKIEDSSHPLHGQALKAALHYGPRPVFKDTVAFEAHLLDVTAEPAPTQVTVKLVKRLRDVADFASPTELYEQIAADIRECHVILEHDAQSY